MYAVAQPPTTSSSCKTLKKQKKIKSGPDTIQRFLQKKKKFNFLLQRPPS